MSEEPKAAVKRISEGDDTEDCQSVDDLSPGLNIVEAQFDIRWEVLEVTDERRVEVQLLSDECPICGEEKGFEDSWNEVEIQIGLELEELVVE